MDQACIWYLSVDQFHVLSRAVTNACSHSPGGRSFLQVFVRRSALVAASQIVRHLPPARLAGAMVGRQQDVQDQVLVERLQWLMSWSQTVAAGDLDDQCRMLAAGCCAWHVELAEGALACLEHLPEAEGPSLAGVGGGGKGRGLGAGVDVKVPKMTDRLVLQG